MDNKKSYADEPFTWKQYASRILFWSRAFEVRESTDNIPPGIMTIKYQKLILIEREAGYLRLKKDYEKDGDYRLSRGYFVPWNAVMKPFVFSEDLCAAFAPLLKAKRIIPPLKYTSGRLPHWKAEAYLEEQKTKSYFLMHLPTEIDTVPKALELIEEDFTAAFQHISLADGELPLFNKEIPNAISGKQPVLKPNPHVPWTDKDQAVIGDYEF